MKLAWFSKSIQCHLFQKKGQDLRRWYLQKISNSTPFRYARTERSETEYTHRTALFKIEITYVLDSLKVFSVDGDFYLSLTTRMYIWFLVALWWQSDKKHMKDFTNKKEDDVLRLHGKSFREQYVCLSCTLTTRYRQIWTKWKIGRKIFRLRVQ